MYIIDQILRYDDSNEAVVVCSGNRYRITVSELIAFDFQEGDEIDDDTVELLDGAVERLACIKKAFDFLSYGDLSEKQLRDKLSKKFPKELSADVASLFVERGYVNDERLAERYAETFYEFKNIKNVGALAKLPLFLMSLKVLFIFKNSSSFVIYFITFSTCDSNGSTAGKIKSSFRIKFDNCPISSNCFSIAS